MTTDTRQEIVALHEFFEQWFRDIAPGRAEQTEAAERFACFERVLDSRFSMVTPSGDHLSRTSLIERLRKARGTRPRIAIAVENVRELAREGTLHVVAYEEWQSEGDVKRGRASVAVLEADQSAPRGWRWRYVQETWLPDPVRTA